MTIPDDHQKLQRDLKSISIIIKALLFERYIIKYISVKNELAKWMRLDFHPRISTL